MPYRVKLYDTIYDVAYNISGSIAAVDALLELNVDPATPPLDWKTYVESGVPLVNRFESYTPDLYTNEEIITEGVPVYNLGGLNNGPVNSAHVFIQGLEQEIENMNDKL